MGTVKSFIRQTIAHLVGDTDAVVAERNYRIAVAGVNGQIHSLNFQKVKEEVALQKAEEKLLKAKYPGEEIEDVEEYLNDIRSATVSVDVAKENLKDTEDAIAFNEGLLKEFEQSVEA